MKTRPEPATRNGVARRMSITLLPVKEYHTLTPVEKVCCLKNLRNFGQLIKDTTDLPLKVVADMLNSLKFTKPRSKTPINTYDVSQWRKRYFGFSKVELAGKKTYKGRNHVIERHCKKEGVQNLLHKVSRGEDLTATECSTIKDKGEPITGYFITVAYKHDITSYPVLFDMLIAQDLLCV